MANWLPATINSGQFELKFPQISLVRGPKCYICYKMQEKVFKPTNAHRQSGTGCSEEVDDQTRFCKRAAVCIVCQKSTNSALLLQVRWISGLFVTELAQVEILFALSLCLFARLIGSKVFVSNEYGFFSGSDRCALEIEFGESEERIFHGAFLIFDVVSLSHSLALC